MGQVLHGSAKTTKAVRLAIQNSEGSLSKLAKRYSLNPKTIAKWKKRDFTAEASIIYGKRYFEGPAIQKAEESTGRSLCQI